MAETFEITGVVKGRTEKAGGKSGDGATLAGAKEALSTAWAS